MADLFEISIKDLCLQGKYNDAFNFLVKSLSKSNFERLIDGIIERTIDKAKSALKSSGLKASEIDEILLVGGSSRIPLVQEKLKSLFGKNKKKKKTIEIPAR